MYKTDKKYAEMVDELRKKKNEKDKILTLVHQNEKIIKQNYER